MLNRSQMLLSMEKDTTPDMHADRPLTSEPDMTSTEAPSTEKQDNEDKCTTEKSSKTKDDGELVLPSVISMNDDELSFSGKAFLELLKGTTFGEMFKQNSGFITLVVVLVVSYVALGYTIRAERLENDRLSKEALNWRYRALTRSSELRERTLRSNIENRLPDSTLHTPTESPYELMVPKADEE